MKIKKIFTELGSWITLIVITLVLAFVIAYFVVSFKVIDGTTMSPTLKSEEVVIFNKLAYKFKNPKRYDIILFKSKSSEGKLLIKRIIGLPGEKVQIKDGVVFVNGEQLIEDTYGNGYIYKAELAEKEIELAKDEYFVLGDNRDTSIDSRYVEVGNVKEKDIEGKLWIRLFPLGNFGKVK